MNALDPDTLIHPDVATAIIHGRHGDPFSVLGVHTTREGVVLRSFQPEATSVVAINPESGQEIATLHRVHGDGIFAARLPGRTGYRLKIVTATGTDIIDDPYVFPNLLGDLDVYLLAEGRHEDLGRVLGAHVTTMHSPDGREVEGVRFAVWAPNATRASVIGSFNHWDGRCHPMRKRVEAGVWELFIPGLTAGTIYKYELLGPNGELLPLKADPVAWYAEIPPATASIVASPAPFQWTDEQWMQQRGRLQAADQPISIYEVHPASWMPAECGDWNTLADRLIPYVQSLGFTHVEFLPVMEHPFGGSWGYQPLGQFAPMARLGTPESFASLVNRLHEVGIGVILDWVPAHFPTDAHGLARFDGTALYEHEDPREGYHYDWNTYIYNLGRNEVRAFLISSAVHWLTYFHADALRVDAVASMLYRDYSRKHGEWIPNMYGGRENLESVSFLQHLSTVVKSRAPGAVLIAEESTAWPGVTRPAHEGGLGFDYKWNMGWMHDTLHYMQEDPVNRSWHHDQMTFGLVYAFSEKFILPLSHDEVVHGKRSLLGRMPGDEWQRFANLRAYYGFMWTHPGKKLLFMGGEIAQEQEWSEGHGTDWYLLDRPNHQGVQRLVADLNMLYRAEPALYRKDCAWDGFSWLVIDDRTQSVFAYMRYGADSDAPVLVVCNLTPVPRHDYRIGVPQGGYWREILNTDAGIYGGSNTGNGGGRMADATPSHHHPASLQLTLPPLATIILKPES
ncbi:1,4-alpha-glucan branching enzyme [Granulibacter bethesdensis]|uniref:1,4-alpha-glucan branching enzyme GlgB n=1 Tax=Granulibacter bethesdensis TaxID=364410 RepID=A0AAN0RCX5_9PROT|nr:1,4-alpha-glucan branching protein GlgB [Granulibacter bethesdensis]AHJ62569.1 1,4-alpha-glucan branching enzyme [Granulibacter bethesdensis]AHJ66866.1 1,4-alpha-glucan branching enzyme [Granulibacter bethesdensis CGDNIH4]